jgi:hypothetical protein
MFDTYEPDARLIRSKVAEAIDAAEGDAPKPEPAADSTGGEAKPAKQKKPKQPEAVTGGSIGSLSDGYAANESQDLDAAC